MTNKEAIEELRDIYKEIDDVFIFTGDKKIEALDLAIKALRIIEIIENGFKQDNNLLMDFGDWEDIKALANNECLEEVENEQNYNNS